MQVQNQGIGPAIKELWGNGAAHDFQQAVAAHTERTLRLVKALSNEMFAEWMPHRMVTIARDRKLRTSASSAPDNCGQIRSIWTNRPQSV